MDILAKISLFDLYTSMSTSPNHVDVVDVQCEPNSKLRPSAGLAVVTSDAKLLLFIFSGTMRQPWRRSALHRVFIVVLLFLAWNRRICGVSSDLQNVETDNGNYDGIAVASDPDPASSSSTDSKMLYDSGVSGEGSEEIDSHQNAFAVQTDGSSESVIEDVNTGIPESLGSPEIPRDKVLDIDQEILTAADEDSSELHSGQVENNKGISSPEGLKQAKTLILVRRRF